MDQQILCIVAGQRSGTTSFRSLVSGSGRFADLGEIFDTATVGLPESFFGYCRARKLLVTDVLSGPDAERLCKDYLIVLREKAGSQHILLDVKFNSWGIIRMPWTYMHQEPYFLAFLKYRRARMAFIWRRDIVAQILSDRISASLGKWHNIKASDAKEPVKLDIQEIRERTKLMCLSESYFYENLKTYPHAAMFCYERLFNANGALNEDVRKNICRLMKENYAFPETCLYHKNEIEKSRIVANYAEAAAAAEEMAAAYRSPVLVGNSELD